MIHLVYFVEYSSLNSLFARQIHLQIGLPPQIPHARAAFVLHRIHLIMQVNIRVNQLSKWVFKSWREEYVLIVKCECLGTMIEPDGECTGYFSEYLPDSETTIHKVGK